MALFVVVVVVVVVVVDDVVVRDTKRRSNTQHGSDDTVDVDVDVPVIRRRNCFYNVEIQSCTITCL
jgi:hypothetical protein